MIEAPEPPHHHHHKTGLPWFDVIVPIAVLCISIASLLNALQSEKSMHALVEQNQRLVSAQSTPLLMLDSSNLDNGKAIIRMTLSNVGTGPARIGWFHITDDKGLDYSGGALYERVETVGPNLPFQSQNINGMLMRSGDERLIFGWPRPDGNASAMVLWNRLDKTDRFNLHATACYCSIFDECKVTDFSDAQPKTVSSCAAADISHKS